ncbi:hypothetical protein V1264_021660 [Littorina saxatilis]|uniref:Uncharacterized protein n=2 Tax=Littorina saxatilis TaxID=31220 RepID=A0AAN9AIT4_9CAEN
MGRSKGKSQDTGGGGGGPSGPSSSSLPNNRASSLSPAPVISASSSTTSAQADTKIKDLKKELFGLIHNIQEERDRGQHNIVNIDKTHERMQQEARVTPYYKNKLRGLYNTAMQDAEAEAE